MARRIKSKNWHIPNAFSGARNLLDIEPRLNELLRELSTVLVDSGYGISRFNKLVRRAYFASARSLESVQRKKFSIARVAAATGLTRSEVSRLARVAQSDAGPEPANRAQRVALGWKADGVFKTALGKPRVLPFSGPRGSFSNLVQKYSGDIPARAMLLEMQRLGMIVVDSRGNVRLTRYDVPFSRHALTSLGAMIPWVRFLAQRSQDLALTAQAHEVRLNFSSLRQSLAALKEFEERTDAFLRSVRELGSPKSATNEFSMEITIALAARAPKAGLKNQTTHRGKHHG